MKSKISPHGRPTAHDREQHMRICALLGVSREANAAVHASDAVQAMLEQHRPATRHALLHLYLELENLAFHMSMFPDISAVIHGLAEQAKSLLPHDEHP